MEAALSVVLTRGSWFSAPLTGIASGEVAVIDQALPGRAKLSTGVLALYADDVSFTFMTPEGHGLAGWITFSTPEREGTTVAQAQILMRANDPLSEFGLAPCLHALVARVSDVCVRNPGHKGAVHAPPPG